MNDTDSSSSAATYSLWSNMSTSTMISTDEPDSMSLRQINQVQSLLDRNEIFSIVFLLFENVEVALQHLHLEALQCKVSTHWPVLDSSLVKEGNSSTNNEGLLVQWVKTSPNLWKRKMEEALLIIKNYQCLKVLGKKKDENDMIMYFPHRYDFSVEIDKVRKFLYMMVEDLTLHEWESLLTYLGSDLEIKTGTHIPPLPQDSHIPAEYFLLLFLSRGLFKIRTENSRMDFTSLSTNLKKIGNLQWAHRVMDFEEYCNQEAFQPTIVERKFQLDPSYPGFILIINQVKFNGKETIDGPLDDRFGSEKDAKRLCQTFALLNFRHKTVTNIPAEDMRHEIKSSVQQFCNANTHGSERCFVLAILSHGNEMGVYGTDGEILETDEISNMMRSVKLQGMPKLLICQSCKGKSQVAIVNGKRMIMNTDQPGCCLTDLLIYSSSVKGFAAYRSPSLGSFFIYALCEVLLLSGISKVPKDFLTLTHEVNHKLSSNQIFIKKVTVEMTPEMQTTLTKALYLLVPYERQNEANLLLKQWREEYHSINQSWKGKFHDQTSSCRTNEEDFDDALSSQSEDNRSDEDTDSEDKESDHVEEQRGEELSQSDEENLDETLIASITASLLSKYNRNPV